MVLKMKDLAIHLRKVHFTLLVLCITMFVSVFFTDKTRIEKASEQLRFPSHLFEDRLDIVVNLEPVKKKTMQIDKAPIQCEAYLPDGKRTVSFNKAHVLSHHDVHQPRNWAWLRKIEFPIYERRKEPLLGDIISFMWTLGRARIIEISGCKKNRLYFLGDGFSKGKYLKFPNIKTWNDIPKNSNILGDLPPGSGFMGIDGELLFINNYTNSTGTNVNVFGITLEYQIIDGNVL